MKRLILSILVAVSFAALFAAGFSFTLAPSDGAMYREPLADPYSFVSRISIQKALDPDLRPAYVRAAVMVYKDGVHQTTQYMDLPYDYEVVNDPDTFSTYLHMRVGVTTSLVRLRYEGGVFESIDAEISAGAALNTIFNIFSNSNALDFDGTWFAGANVRFADKYLLRFGIHHFSGHYGDETLDKFYNTNQVDFSDNGKINADFEGKDPAFDYYIHNLVEYVRDNYWIVGASADLPYGFRTYCELEWPWKDVWLRPFSSTPLGHRNAEGRELMEYVGGSSEGFTEEQVANEMYLKSLGHYNALRFHAGIEFSYEIRKVGTLFLSADVQFHQDGQTKHRPGQYSPFNPWEKELTVSSGLDLGEFVPGRNVRIELIYHDGRVTGTDFFYQRIREVSIGMSIS